MHLQFSLLDLFSFSILIAAAMGWVRYRRIHPTYHPFLYLCWLGLLNELISYFLIYNGYSNAVNSNLFVLGEVFLITWQLRNWNRTHYFKGFYTVFVLLCIAFWALEMFLVPAWYQTITCFRIFYSFVIVIMSIECLNKQLSTERGRLLRNPVVLICLAFILYFTYTVIVGVFWIYGFGGSVDFRRNMVWILIYINVLCNLIYALAILWMPAKLRFTLPF